MLKNCMLVHLTPFLLVNNIPSQNTITCYQLACGLFQTGAFKALYTFPVLQIIAFWFYLHSIPTLMELGM